MSRAENLYNYWDAEADRKSDDMREGWEATQAMLAEDEQWAQHLHSQFHGQEY